MSTNTSTMDLTQFDVRSIPCRQKHAQIFQRWESLAVGEHFVLINDHDPVPLYYQFAAQFPDAFSWEYLVAGPDEFHVKITRLSVSPDQPSSGGLPPWPPRGNASPSGPLEKAEDTVDVRGLEPPDPMVRILTAVESLVTGERLIALTDRKPIHLYPELESRGIDFNSEETPDGTWRTTLSRK